jgi:hypothetical protein
VSAQALGSQALGRQPLGSPSVGSGVRLELRLLWRGLVLPICLAVCALFAISNVGNQVDAVHSDLTLVQHTRAEYANNGMDFDADLRKPAHVVIEGNEQSVTNLARYDYDTMAASITALSPLSTIPETLKYFSFIFFPVIFFLVGLWMSTVQRRYSIEKNTLTRFGTARVVAARQLAVLIAAAGTIVAVLAVEAVARTIAFAVESSSLPFSEYPPIGTPAPQNGWAQWGILVLVVAFFGGAGIAVGATVGVFAVPAVLFLIWDLVIPFLGPNDPRNWFVVLGHSAFNYSSGFQLAPAIPLAAPIALTASVAVAVALLGLGYLGIRIRNPLAT